MAKREFKKKNLKKNLLALVCGLLFALDLWAWHWSIQYIGPGLATILGNFQVFVLSIVGFLVFKEKIRLRFVLSIPLAFLGLFLIIGMDIDNLSRDYMTGIILGIATAGFYSMFLLLLRLLQSDKQDFSLFYYLMLLSVACSFFLGGKIYVANESFAIPDMTTLVSLIGLGFFIQFGAWVMISNALPKVKADQAHWTAKKIHGYLKEKFKLQISYQSVIGWLHKENYALKVPRLCRSWAEKYFKWGI